MEATHKFNAWGLVSWSKETNGRGPSLLEAFVQLDIVQRTREKYLSGYHRGNAIIPQTEISGWSARKLNWPAINQDDTEPDEWPINDEKSTPIRKPERQEVRSERKPVR